MAVFRTESPGETAALGSDLSGKAFPGMVVTLDGDLGAGKTVFAKGFAAGLGIKEPVTSPTFTIMQEYEGGRLPLYHFDVYRLESPDEMLETGLDEYLYGEGVCLIEWSEIIREVIPAGAVSVRIKRDDGAGENSRVIEIRNDNENTGD